MVDAMVDAMVARRALPLIRNASVIGTGVRAVNAGGLIFKVDGVREEVMQSQGARQWNGTMRPLFPGGYYPAARVFMADSLRREEESSSPLAPLVMPVEPLASKR